MKPKLIPITTLLHDLSGYPPDTLVSFGAGDLSFGRVKERGPLSGPKIVNIEFNELYKITLDQDQPDPPPRRR